jgi:hypothetical protein
MTTKIPVELSSTPSIVDAGDATAITITSDEKVGIGTSGPSTNLHIGSGTAGNALGVLLNRGATTNFFEAHDGTKSAYIGTDNSQTFIKVGSLTNHAVQISQNNSAAIFIDTSKNVGIGTTSPQGQVHVKKDSSETDLLLQSNIGGTGSAQGGRLILALGALSNTGSGNADTRAGDTLGLIRFKGQGTDYSYDGGELYVEVQTGDGDDDRSSQGTMMIFKTMNVGVPYAQENFRIAQDGTLTATDTTIGSNSDRRIKKNITDFTGGLDLVKSLQPRTFEFKDETGKRKSGIRRGFVAQEILEKDDYWVYEQEANDQDDSEYEYTKDTEKVYVSKLTDKDAMYVSAIKELQEQIETLQSEINTLKGGE